MQLLAAHAGAFVATHDVAEKLRAQVIAVVVGGAAGGDGPRISQQLADQRRRSRGSCYHLPRLLTEPDAELELLPCLGVLPRCQLINPRRFALETTEAFGLISRA